MRVMKYLINAKILTEITKTESKQLGPFTSANVKKNKYSYTFFIKTLKVIENLNIILED